MLTGGREAGGTFTIDGVVFDYGAFINALISFLLTAIAIYFFVVAPVNNLARHRGKLDADELSREAQLLAEIRDRLPASGDSIP